MKRSWRLSIFLLLCFACSKPLPQLDDIDLQAWKDDYEGCLNKRIGYSDALQSQKDKLKGLSERDLVQLLGRPNRNDLSEHHEKFYSYFIECNEDSSSLMLEVRFNATGVSKEVTFVGIK